MKDMQSSWCSLDNLELHYPRVLSDVFLKEKELVLQRTKREKNTSGRAIVSTLMKFHTSSHSPFISVCERCKEEQVEQII